MKFLSIFVLIVVFLLVLTRFQVVEVAAADDVKFRGTVLTAEDIAFPICYFMPYCYMLVEEILHDPQDLLDLGVSVSVCYTEIMNLTEYERVEVYGFYFEDGGPCPMQFCGHVVCESEYGYYVSRTRGPKAEFTPIPDTASIGESIKFDASASLPGWDGTYEMPITEYRWDFGGGIKITTPTPIFYYNFISPGTYYVTLTVYAPGATPETDSTTKKVTITAIPVGGYSSPMKGYTAEKPLTLHLALIAILAASFTMITRKTRKRTTRP